MSDSDSIPEDIKTEDWKHSWTPFAKDIYRGDFSPVEKSFPLVLHLRDEDRTVQPFAAEHTLSWLGEDLDLARLNDIHEHMWMCGRPINARPLHRQKMLGRKLVLIEQVDMHLLYHSDTLFIKPLPTYILCPGIWKEYLTSNIDLHQSACGLLLSYIWLIRTPLDFRIAKDEHLVPDQLAWSDWRDIVQESLRPGSIDATSLHQVNRRYHFGELRLDRINSAYRFIPRLAHRNFVRGYLYGYNRYKAFVKRSFGWVIAVFAWFTLILSAMQVGVAVPYLHDKEGFWNACLGFSLFSMLLVIVLAVIILFYCTGIFFYNMIAAILHARQQRRRRFRRARQFVGGKNA